MKRHRELSILISVLAICALAVWRIPSPSKPNAEAPAVAASPEILTASPQALTSYASQDLSIGGVVLGESRRVLSFCSWIVRQTFGRTRLKTM